MHIAILGRFCSTSANGVERTIEGHVRCFAESGKQVTLLTFEAPAHAAATELLDLGVKVVVLPVPLLDFALKLWSIRDDFDVLWLHSVFTVRNWISFLLLSCPWVCTPNGGYSPGQIAYRRPFIKWLALKIVEKRQLENAVFVHVLSHHEEEQVHLVAPRAVTVIAPNGSLPPSEIKTQVPDGPIRFLFIGRLAWMHKGLDRFINALGKVDPNREWYFDLVGPGTPSEISYLKNLCISQGIEEKVKFHGPLYGDEKDSLIKKCHVFVHTSRWEGMPFSVIEALREGLPVLITRGTNMSELVSEYNAGWLAGDDYIIDSINTVLETTPEEFAKKRFNAQLLIREKLHWHTICMNLLNALSNKLIYTKSD